MTLNDIRWRPVFYVSFTKDEVILLTEEAKRHYDGTCQSLARPGGLIFGLNNVLEFSSDETATWSLKWADVDLLCKVLERTCPPLFWSLKKLIDCELAPGTTTLEDRR